MRGGESDLQRFNVIFKEIRSRKMFGSRLNRKLFMKKISTVLIGSSDKSGLCTECHAKQVEGFL